MQACSGSAEHALLTQFFAASRLRDLTALQQIATTRFEPRERGTVLDFKVVGVRHTSGDLKTATVDATVHLPSGEIASRRFDVTMRRVGGRWMVEAVADVNR